MLFQKTLPFRVLAAAAPVAQQAGFLWKPAPLTSADPLYSQLPRRRAGVTKQPFDAFRPLDRRPQLILDSHAIIVPTAKEPGPGHVRSSPACNHQGFTDQAANSVESAWTSRSAQSHTLRALIAVRHQSE